MPVEGSGLCGARTPAPARMARDGARDSRVLEFTQWARTRTLGQHNVQGIVRIDNSGLQGF